MLRRRENIKCVCNPLNFELIKTKILKIPLQPKQGNEAQKSGDYASFKITGKYSHLQKQSLIEYGFQVTSLIEVIQELMPYTGALRLYLFPKTGGTPLNLEQVCVTQRFLNQDPVTLLRPNPKNNTLFQENKDNLEFYRNFCH